MYRMFNQQELQILIGGVDSPIDLDDLRKHTQYGGAYKDDDPIIDTFWKVSWPFNLLVHVFKFGALGCFQLRS